MKYIDRASDAQFFVNNILLFKPEIQYFFQFIWDFLYTFVKVGRAWDFKCPHTGFSVTHL